MNQVKSFFGNRIVKRVLWQSAAYLVAAGSSALALYLQAWKPESGVEFLGVLGALAIVLQNISKEINTWLSRQSEEGDGGGIA